MTRDKSKLTSIILLTFNQLELTKKCIESIGAYTEVPYELIIVDNNSTDGTKKYLEIYKQRSTVNIKVIYNKTNKGFFSLLVLYNKGTESYL